MACEDCNCGRKSECEIRETPSAKVFAEIRLRAFAEARRDAADKIPHSYRVVSMDNGDVVAVFATIEGANAFRSSQSNSRDLFIDQRTGDLTDAHALMQDIEDFFSDDS